MQVLVNFPLLAANWLAVEASGCEGTKDEAELEACWVERWIKAELSLSPYIYRYRCVCMCIYVYVICACRFSCKMLRVGKGAPNEDYRMQKQDFCAVGFGLI